MSVTLRLFLLGGIIVGVLRAGPLAAWDDPSALCLAAAEKAALSHGVPYNVLLSVALVETGRDDRPWPWTVNVAGEGEWFDTREAAEDHAQSVLDAGKTNLDLGCFQLNVHWHSKGFVSLSDMLDPDRNADYAAAVLARNFAESEDWAEAAASYHSRTPDHADRYRAKFEATLAALEDPALGASEANAAMNGFPLLMAGTGAGAGSLVPLSAPAIPLIGGY